MMRARTKLAWSIAAGALALALLALMSLPIGREARPSARATAERAAPSLSDAPPREPAVRSTPAAATLVNTAAGDRHPHPITAEHRRLYRDADLIDGAAAALRKNDVAHARALLAQHRTEYAPGEGSDSEGLALLADCIERTDAGSIERARAFYGANTHSMVRRQIRKQCLE
jgi:hypothetical protein